MNNSHHPWRSPVAALVALAFMFGTSLASQEAASPKSSFHPAAEYEKGFVPKDFVKLFGKKPIKLVAPLPENLEETDSEETMAGLDSYVAMVAKKKLKTKQYKQHGAALYAKVAQVCALEELDCSEDLEKFKFVIKGGTKPIILKTMSDIVASVKEKLEEVSSELEEGEGVSPEDLDEEIFE